MNAPIAAKAPTRPGWYQRRRRRLARSSGLVIHPLGCPCSDCATTGEKLSAEIADGKRAFAWGGGAAVLLCVAIAAAQGQGWL